MDMLLIPLLLIHVYNAQLLIVKFALLLLPLLLAQLAKLITLKNQIILACLKLMKQLMVVLEPMELMKNVLHVYLDTT